MGNRIIKTDDSLAIGFNNANVEFGDKACLTIARKVRDEIHVVNTFYGENAKRLYFELVGNTEQLKSVKKHEKQ